MWVKRKVVLYELDPEIRRNFERKGWLPLLDVDHPPLATLIKEFYSNLSVHSYDSNSGKKLETGWRVYHYSYDSGLCSWGAYGPTSYLSLQWVSSPRWHYVISYWIFYLVGFWSSDHLSRVNWDSLSLFLDFLPFHLAHLTFAHYSNREMCIFVCTCHWCSYELSSSFNSFFDWGT